MNIFLGQNIGRGITFKILISWTVQSRFRQILAEMLENDQSASGLFFFYWVDGILGQYRKQLKLNLFKTWFCVQVFSSAKAQRNLILPLSDLSQHLLCHVDFLISSFFKRYLALKAQNLSCYSSKASILYSKAYFTIQPSTWQSTICLV